MEKQDPGTGETFIAALTGIEHGAVATKANDLLMELVKSVNGLGRKGSVTVTIEIRPAKGNSANVQVAATATAKMPQPDAPWGLFFFTEDGGLTRDDPRYAEALFEVDREAGR